jgi:hypothetical protein
MYLQCGRCKEFKIEEIKPLGTSVTALIFLGVGIIFLSFMYLWLIFPVIGIVLGGMMIYSALDSMKHYYRCQNCKTRWKPTDF